MKSNIAQVTCALSIVIIFSISAYSQSENSNKNYIHVSIAPDIYFWGVNVFYDRIILDNGNFKGFARIGYGAYSRILVSNGTNTFGQLGAIIGSNKTRFEIAAGVSYNIDNEAYSNTKSIIPAVSAGITIQNPKKKFRSRAGIGFPEGLYYGLGFTF